MVIHGVLPIVFTRRLPRNFNFLINALQSSGMMASFFALAWIAVCMLWQYRPHKLAGNIQLVAMLASCCIWAERKSRRAEIALFVLPRALEVLWRRWLRLGGRALPHGDKLIFACAMASLMVQSKYVHILLLFFF